MAKRTSSLVPFQHKTFRSLWSAALISNLGTLVEGAAAAWLMTSITTSHGMVALVQSSTTLPYMIFSLAAGALADKFDRRRIMLTAQLLMVCVSAFLAFLTYAGNDTLDPSGSHLPNRLWLGIARSLLASLHGRYPASRTPAKRGCALRHELQSHAQHRAGDWRHNRGHSRCGLRVPLQRPLLLRSDRCAVAMESRTGTTSAAAGGFRQCDGGGLPLRALVAEPSQGDVPEFHFRPHRRCHFGSPAVGRSRTDQRDRSHLRRDARLLRLGSDLRRAPHRAGPRSSLQRMGHSRCVLCIGDQLLLSGMERARWAELSQPHASRCGLDSIILAV